MWIIKVMQLTNSYYWFKSALSEEDCDRIIQHGIDQIGLAKQQGKKIDGVTFGNSEKSSMPDAIPQGDLARSQVDTSKKMYIRDSKVSWLNDQWIYDLVLPFVHEANTKAGWNFDIDYSESFQFTVYEPDGFYGWHKDGMSDHFGIYKRYIHGVTAEPLKKDGSLPSGYTDDNNMIGKVRKLSVTINLNNPGDYEGGNLKFDFGHHTEDGVQFHECDEIRPKGSIIVFPSFIDHCVTPVTSGTRYSLVLWNLGRPFK